MKKWPLRIMGAVIVVMTIVLYWTNPSTLHRVELLLQNLHFQWRGPVAAGDEVVIAAIDEKSIDELGRWPWTRYKIARLVENLVADEARVIGFDVIFSSPEENPASSLLGTIRENLKANDGLNPTVQKTLEQMEAESDPDARFATVLEQTDRVVLGYFFHYTREGVEHLSEETRHQYFEDIRPGRFRGFLKSSADLDLSSLGFTSAYAVESSLSVFSRKTPDSGFISFPVDSDGSMRRLPLIVRYRDESSGKDYYFPPMSMRILEKYLDGTLLFKVNELGVEKIILDADEPIEIPSTDAGELFINYLGPRRTFPHYSISDIVLDRLPAGTFKDKIVLVGATAQALEDLRVTPFDPALPGVEIHGTMIDNILRRDFIRDPAWLPLFDSAYLLFAGMVFTLVYSRVRAIAAIVILVTTLAGHLGFAQWMFETEKLWISDIFPLLENILIYATLTIARYLAEEKQKKFIEKMFGHYLSPRVVQLLLNDPSLMKLGGEEKELTAYFTDLAKFSTFSEQLSAEELVNFLNMYLGEMTDILLKYEGTLDKYDGDAIKAFFGAPVFFEDHARRACWVCIEMQERLAVLRERWKREGLPEAHQRIGINTGQIVVGNLGSKTRMNYGMNGDSVNLAARLESSNKFYGTQSIISESTYLQAKDHIEVRELDTIRVVGRATPVKIYELLSKKGELEEGVRQLVSIFNEGLKKYQNQEWERALERFKQALKMKPDDGPSRTYRDRCLEYIENPPPVNWDGVYVLTSK